MTMKLIEKNGKKYLEMTTVYQGKPWIEHAKVYDVNGKPYIKRMSEKIFLSEEVLTGEPLTF